jgi:prevent-host-death family protein
MDEPVEERKEGGHVERVEIASIELRAQLTEILNRVAYNGRRYVITRHGKPYAALIGPDDLERLEAAEATGAAHT